MRTRSLLLLSLVPFLLGFEDGSQARKALDRAFDNLYSPGVLAAIELSMVRGARPAQPVTFAYGRKRRGGETRTLLYSATQDRKAPRMLLLQSRGDRDKIYVGDGRRGQVRPASAGEYRWPLFGSDFSYEDFRAHEADDYRIEVLGSDLIDGEPCRVLRLRPMSGPYKMMLMWLSTERPVIIRTDYFDRKGLWKRYRVEPEHFVKHFDWWVPMRDEMFDLRTGRRTTRKVRNILVGAEVPEDMFTLTQLSRGRMPSF
ncbi:MAG: outer membrane lipoprotein-sorting protein [bacterium]|nr:outer membrane lipoprotein-sorting protein [bacterium]